MIKNLEVKNFKSWEKLQINFSQITGLFGTNSSGKSSILQFLLTLKQTKDNLDRSITLDFGNSTSFTNLGSYKDTVFRHEQNRKVEWKIAWTLDNTLTISNPEDKRTSVLFQGKDISINSSVRLRSKQVVCDHVEYFFSDQKFSIRRKSEDATEFTLNTSGKSDFKFIRTTGRVWQLPGPIKSYGFPDQAKTYFKNSNFLSDFELSYEDLMNKIYYLGPLRDYPKREYLWAGSRPIDVGVRGEKVVDAILAATAAKEERNIKHKSRNLPFEKIIGYWLKEIGLIHNFRVSEIAGSNIYRVKVKVNENSEEVLITDVGFGVSQFLPVLVLLYYAPENSTILLEQPEIHLHPAIQSWLGDIIISAATRRNLQIIFESHSEHLLRRLQLRIAQEKLDAKNLSIYFCTSNKGHSEISDINVDLYGEIRNWPKNFFGDEFGEISSIQKAIIKKKINEKESHD